MKDERSYKPTHASVLNTIEFDAAKKMGTTGATIHFRDGKGYKKEVGKDKFHTVLSKPDLYHETNINKRFLQIFKILFEKSGTEIRHCPDFRPRF